MRRLRDRKGQGTLEYLLVLAGIIAALIAFKVVVQGKVSEGLNKAGDAIQGSTSTALDSLDINDAWK